MVFDFNDIEAIESDYYKDGQRDICKKLINSINLICCN
jgi:hypothetical protein